MPCDLAYRRRFHRPFSVRRPPWHGRLGNRVPQRSPSGPPAALPVAPLAAPPAPPRATPPAGVAIYDSPPRPTRGNNAPVCTTVQRRARGYRTGARPGMRPVCSRTACQSSGGRRAATAAVGERGVWCGGGGCGGARVRVGWGRTGGPDRPDRRARQ